MAALIAFGIAVLALAVAGAGAWAVVTWRRERRSVDVLAARLQAEGRIEELTVQTLAAMREAARRCRRP